MAANEELGKLSPEQIQKLANTISEAKSLSSQQEEIITKVLAGETEIGKIRIASLEEYFDIYSRNLDLIARKYSSLNDAFLILDNKLVENYKTLSSDVAGLEQQLAGLAKQQGKSTSAETKNNVDRNGDSKRKHKPENASTKGFDDTVVKLLRQIANTLKQSNNTNNIIKYAQPEDGAAAAGSGGSGGGNGRGDTNHPIGAAGGGGANNSGDGAWQTVSDDTRSALQSHENDSGNGDSDITKQLDKWKKFFQQTEEERQNAIIAGTEELNFNKADIEQRYKDQHINMLEEQAKQVEKIESRMIDLEVARMQKEMGLVDQITQYRLDSQQKAIDAEVEALNALNNLDAKLASAEQHSDELGANRAREVAAQESSAETKKREEQIAKERAKLELKYKRQNNGVLNKEDAARIEKELAAKYKTEKKNEENLSKERARLSKIDSHKAFAEERQEMQAQANVLLGKGYTLDERKQALFTMTHDENGDFDGKKALAAAINAVSDLIAQLNTKIDSIGSYKGGIDTRLQGSNNKKVLGSYWDQLNRDMMSVGAVTPFFRQEDFANNIKTLVEKGISFDLKQRAFLMTIQEKIANTFNVADGTLLRLIRIQQEDSTAGRLGMESALNAFLNNMYETTEYLSDVAGSVRGSLQEMEALMGGAEATEVEYQVQKWMGSLYSVGMSQEAVQSIAGAFGQIAAGQVDALTSGSGAGNLLVMAANNAGLTISDILTKGLDAKETNKLLKATVEYLADIAQASKDNQVVQQQLANVFGVRASDLRAATNLASENTTEDIFKDSKTYDNMLKRLNDMAGSMILRTSIGEMMTNIWENGQYTIASSMANNPVSYLLYKLSSLLQETTGGIPIPFINVYGFGFDLETTVADLMRVGALGTGILGSLGSMVSGLASSFSGRSMLKKMGIESGSGLSVTPRGDGGGLSAGDDGGGAQTTSGSGYVGNSSGSDIKDSTIQSAEDDGNKQMIEAKEEAEANQIDFINANVLKIYELLDDVANGKRSLNVRMAGYGLTSLGSGQPISGMSGHNGGDGNTGHVGGVMAGQGGGGSAQNNNISSTPNSMHGSGSSYADSYNPGSNLGLGGWTMM